MTIQIIVTIFTGLIFGSFINALVWRIHTKRKWWGNERSICPHCKHILAPKDLIPVVSWLLVKGRCRYCKKPISAQYPIVEILTGISFSLSLYFWPFKLTGIGWVVFAVWLFVLMLFIALSVYDIKWMLLPNSMVLAVTIATAILILALGIYEANYSIMWAPLGGLTLFGVLWLLFQVSKGKWIGGGDVKLAFTLGLLAGSPVKALLVLFLASFIGTIVVLPLLATGKSKISAKIPFGPLLMIATVIIFFFGQALIDWYTRTLLYY